LVAGHGGAIAAQNGRTSRSKILSDTVEGKESVAIATGYESKVKGALGCWLVLSEWNNRNGEYHIDDVQCVRVDGEKIKADTWYQLIGGEFAEVS
jgi:hypothetical protein